MDKLELKIPPVVLALVAAGCMWAIADFEPWGSLSIPLRLPLAVSVAGIGSVVTAVAVLAFRKSGTTVDPFHPDATSRMVVSGIYRYSRNPMYVGFLLILVGWAVFLAAILPIMVLPGFLAYLTRFQILPEERILLSRFGQEYAAYMRTVRRWL